MMETRLVSPMKRSRGPALLLLAAAIACTSDNPGAAVDPRPDIAAASRAFSDAYVAGDTAGIRNVYTTDAVLLPPGREVRGADAIVRYFAPGPNRVNVSHAMESSELTVTGDIAVDVGTWSNTWRVGDAEQQTASERYLVVWRRGPDGRWRIAYDMWHRPAGP